MLALIAIAHGANCFDTGAIDALRVDIDLTASVLSEEWTVAFDEAGCTYDPENLPASLVGARVVGEPKSSPTGRQVVVRRRSVLSGDGSGTLDPWRALSAQTRVTFRAPGGVPLQVFTDEDAHRFTHNNRTTIWWDAGDVSVPSLMWTSWSDWVRAGTVLERGVLGSVPAASELGSLGRSLRNVELSTLVDRLDTALVLQPTEATGWTAGRPTSELLASGRATASERGYVLLAMLDAAGFKARPAWFTPDDNPVIPRTLPAPHLLMYPAIAVSLGGELLYLDPGAMGARPPEVPARIRGGRVLVAGRHLAVPRDTGAPRGQVRVEGTFEVEPSGRVIVVASIRPTGSAEQVMRSRLAGLEAEKWASVVDEWITPRGVIRDLVVDVRGQDGLVPFEVLIRFAEPEKLQGFGAALRGVLHDLVAPRLAAFLPPGVAIEERLTVVPPEGKLALTAIRPEPLRSTRVLLNRSLSSDGPNLGLSTNWRVLGADSPTLDGLQTGTEVLLFPDDRSASRAARRLGLPASDLRVIQAMLQYRLGDERTAKQRLATLHPKLSIAEISTLLARYLPPGDRRPWDALVQLVDSDEERLTVIDGLLASGDRRQAWQLAAFMARDSPSPLDRAAALVQVSRFQGPELPDGTSDPEGHRAWRDPIKLLERARQLAGTQEDIVRLDLARAYLRYGQAMRAQDLLDKEMADPTPLAQAVMAEFGAVTGIGEIDVLGNLTRAIERAPFDPAVREAVGRAKATLGLRRQGVADVLLAAELVGGDETRWLAAADFAADYGDLSAAVFASRRASDLQPNAVVPAVKLQLYAKLARDEANLALAIDRSGNDLYADIGDGLEALVELAPDWELALLRQHVDEVEGNRRMLAKRAALHFERGMLEDAALDGSLMIDRHADASGAKYLLAGVTTRFWHSDPDSLVRRYTQSSEAREARMDLQLVLGEVPTTTGSRGNVLSRARTNPAAVAADAVMWPVAMRDFTFVTPEGFAPNRYLSGVRGVIAVSDPERQMTVLITEKSTGVLPPPLGNVFEHGPTVLSTRTGASVFRMDGGALPVFAGLTTKDGRDVFGLGLSPAAARDAVLYGTGQLAPPTGD